MKVVAMVGTRTQGKDSLMHVGRLFVECFNRLSPQDIVISGGCGTGADYWAKKRCGETGRDYLEVPALWSAHGKAAGPMRNRCIAKVCTHMVAFWDGESPGTRNAIEEAIKMNKPVWIVAV